MINFIQLNQNIIDWESNIINFTIWEKINKLLFESAPNIQIIEYINEISIQYNIDKRNILKYYFNYIIRNKKEYITPDFLNVIEVIMHMNDTNISHIINYFILHLKNIYSKNPNLEK
jgi:hypothetical protein